MHLPAIPDNLNNALILLAIDAALAFIACQHIMLLIADRDLWRDVGHLFRFALFVFGLLFDLYFAYSTVGIAFAIGLIVLALIEAVLMFRLWPEIRQELT